MDSQTFIHIMLVIIGALILRLLRGIDENTKAVSALSLSVKGLSSETGNQKEKIDFMEKEHVREFEKVNTAVELVRGRLHELSNEVAGLKTRRELEDHKASHA